MITKIKQHITKAVNKITSTLSQLRTVVTCACVQNKKKVKKLMTQNKVMFNITEQIPPGAFVINVERPHGEDLGTIAVFISALLLSTGAFLSQVIQACTRSRCKEILCPCSKCVREVPSAFEQSV